MPFKALVQVDAPDSERVSVLDAFCRGEGKEIRTLVTTFREVVAWMETTMRSEVSVMRGTEHT
jgi:hypothetical protein